MGHYGDVFLLDVLTAQETMVLMTVLSLMLVWLTADPTAVAFDKARFAGRWYDHAHVETFFLKGCEDATATYTLKSNGEFDVDNRCVKGGSPSGKGGSAWVDDASKPNLLTLQMVWPFRSKLEVLEHDDVYSWALLGTPDKKKAWVLTRSPQLDEPQRAELFKRLEALGYDTKQLKVVTHHLPDAGVP